MTAAGGDPRAWLNRLVAAVDDHDLDRLVGCFHEDYVNENPAHPGAGFRGNAQVRRNWTQIFGAVPDIRARTLRTAVDDAVLWTEWEMSGTRRDGGVYHMRGVFIFGIEDGRARWARMFLEPVEQASGDADAVVRRLTGGKPVETSEVTS